MIDSSENSMNRSSYLKELEVEIYTEGVYCQRGEYGDDSNFCAKPVKVLDDHTCSADSGGPLIAKVRFFYRFFLLLFFSALHVSTMLLHIVRLV